MLIQEGIVTVIMLDSQEPLKLKMLIVIVELAFIVYVNQDPSSCYKNGQNTK